MSLWDNFVYSVARNGSFLHTRAFFAHNPANATDDASLMFWKNTQLLAVLPAALYEIAGKKVLHTHPRATYGGFVVSPAVGVGEALEMVELLIAWAQAAGVSEIIVVNPLRIYHQIPSEEADYALWRHGFGLKSRSIEAVIDLETPPYQEKTTQTAIRKAKKDIFVHQSDDFLAFWAILDQNLAQKHGVSPVHSVSDILYLRSLVGEKAVWLMGGYTENGKLVAGIVLFDDGKRVLHAQYIGMNYDFQHMRPLNALVDALIAHGRARGYRYLNLGSVNEANGLIINSGLARFKEGFGARGILRETMSLTLTT